MSLSTRTSVQRPCRARRTTRLTSSTSCVVSASTSFVQSSRAGSPRATRRFAAQTVRQSIKTMTPRCSVGSAPKRLRGAVIVRQFARVAAADASRSTVRSEVTMRKTRSPSPLAICSATSRVPLRREPVMRIVRPTHILPLSCPRCCTPVGGWPGAALFYTVLVPVRVFGKRGLNSRIDSLIEWPPCRALDRVGNRRRSSGGPFVATAGPGLLYSLHVRVHQPSKLESKQLVGRSPSSFWKRWRYGCRISQPA